MRSVRPSVVVSRKMVGGGGKNCQYMGIADGCWRSKQQKLRRGEARPLTVRSGTKTAVRPECLPTRGPSQVFVVCSERGTDDCYG